MRSTRRALAGGEQMRMKRPIFCIELAFHLAGQDRTALVRSYGYYTYERAPRRLKIIAFLYFAAGVCTADVVASGLPVADKYKLAAAQTDTAAAQFCEREAPRFIKIEDFIRR